MNTTHDPELTEKPGITPPPLPRPIGHMRVFTPWIQTRKVVHGFEKIIDVYSQEQMKERDQQWMKLLAVKVGV